MTKTYAETNPMTDGLAKLIREEKLILFSLLNARNYYDSGQQLTRNRLLQEAITHQQRVGELLMKGRKLFTRKEHWQQWLRDHCLMNESAASRYLQSQPIHI